MVSALPVALLAATLVATALAGAAVADGPDDRITICHKPGHEGSARTMQVARSAWPAHEGHGDHQGACTEADRAAPAPSPPKPAPPPPPPTRVALWQRADGDVDGDARVEATVANRGDATALAVRLDGQLGGDGRWTVVAPSGCGLQDGRLRCELGDLPAGARRTVTLAYDGPLRVCDTVQVELAATAANDSSHGDDRAKETVRVGACSPTDPPG